MKTLAAHKKTLSSVITVALAWGTTVVQSAPTAITGSEWIAGGILLAGSLGVYGYTNRPA